MGKSKNQGVSLGQTGAKLTPLMQQYWEVKNQHTDKVLLFRMGDFYEMFHDDAVTAAPILNIALTARNKKSGDETPMCGFPHHSVAGPISKLLEAGHKVAICDQVEDPKLAKGLVKRAVTRVLSPGMVFDPETLDQISANYMAAFDEHSVSFADVSTGEAFYFITSSTDLSESLMTLLKPTELVLTSGQRKTTPLQLSEVCLSVHDAEAEGVEELPGSARRLLSYVQSMSCGDAVELRFRQRQTGKTMGLTERVIRHLEVFETYRGDKKGSLFHAINRTKTSAGARKLKDFLRFPLRDAAEINERLDQVSYWQAQAAELQSLRETFSRLGDIERRLAKLGQPSATPRDLQSFAESLLVGLQLSPKIPGLDQFDLPAIHDLVDQIENTLVDEAPIQTKEGGFIRKGIYPELDELAGLSESSQEQLRQLEAREKKATGISTLKVKYNSVFGYYIEVTKAHTDKVPDHYKRKQTLTNAERYLTQELSELEEKILSARSKRVELEMDIFLGLKKKLLHFRAELLGLAEAWAQFDVLTSFAWLALEKSYCRPSFTEGAAIDLVGSRHPVVEQQSSNRFVANDVKLEAGHCLLLTGPNMAGKSTIMRQVALCVLLAQIGCFVPADQASLPVFHRLFTRVGASDDLSEGLSTFMVEMQEAAEILAQSDNKTLVILDEIGRGTSTYDGMSLAQAILEYLVADKLPYTFFATHYHELTHLERKWPQVHNAHMGIDDRAGRIEFLYSLHTGPANKSYGIDVSKRAGLPTSVIRRARQLLNQHELGATEVGASDQLGLLDQVFEPALPEASFVEEEIKSMAVKDMTPMEALNRIFEWQQKLS